MKKLLAILNILKVESRYYLAAHHAAHSYEFHLLFERLYAPLSKEIDKLTELLFALDQENSIDMISAIDFEKKIFSNLRDPNDADDSIVFAQAQELEDTLLKNIEAAQKENNGEGIKNFMAGLAEDHLRYKYILNFGKE
jgi:DNA-binding ferritin-like protein